MPLYCKIYFEEWDNVLFMRQAWIRNFTFFTTM